MAVSDGGCRKLSNVESWLSELGLEKYAPVFAEAEVDLLALPHLTEDDLKELGLPLGPRRKVFDAIKRFNGQRDSLPVAVPERLAASTLGATSAAPLPAAIASHSAGAERRHLTVMFVDLVGSTKMAAGIDPEDMRDVITRYQNSVAGVVARYEGFAAKFMGDGVLCYFGWPRANEDDAERAVRAGLAIIASVRAASGPDGKPLSCRVGVATGVVIVGDLVGSGATQEAAVVGETPNLAARLQGLAQPNQLVLPRETRSLLGNIFQLEPLGTHSLKGIGEPVDAYAVLGENAPESRFEARHAGALTAIVGRDQELGLMHECWVKAKSGLGQMIVVSGEAGIGKSRITRALVDKIAEDDHARITLQCSPYHTDSAFQPIIQQMTHAAGIQPADGAEARLDKLERLAGVDKENAGLLASLLGIDATHHYGALDLTPSQQRFRTMQMLTRMIVRQSESRPLLLVFEDLHWVDPTSLELLDITLDAIASQKVLILATARPNFQHGFGGHPSVTRFALNRLGREQILSIVSKVAGGKSMPEAVLQIIASRTDGVPLFVEELTKTILESGMLRQDGDALVLDGPLDALAIPGTLHDSLMARLDRLQPIKEVAQTAACIGREFEHRLLASISPLAETELEAALEGLIKAELVYRRGVAPDATYLFKHALVRDAAYESLLKDRRRSIHNQILQGLEKGTEVAPEMLAHHAEAAGLRERAIDLWEAASKAAIGRPAYAEAISHLEHAIALVSPRIEKGERAVVERALSLQLQLCVALFARKGYGADETKAAVEHALVLADKIGETPLRYTVLYGLWVGKYLRAEHAGLAEQAAELITLSKSSAETAHSNRTVAISLCSLGRFTEAQAHLDRARASYDPAVHKGLEIRFGQDLGASLDCYAAINLSLIGETRRARKHAVEAERAALALGHINTICYMHAHLAYAAMIGLDEAALERHAAAAARIASEHHLVVWRDLAEVLRPLHAAGAGDPAGIERYLRADAAFVATKSRLWISRLRIEAGRRALALGLREPACRLASMANAMIDQTGETRAMSDFHRLEGALALARDDREGAEASLKKAMAVACEQGSKTWELRAAIDLARLLLSSDRADEARVLLHPIHNSIEDGDCIEDRAIAQAILADLTM